LSIKGLQTNYDYKYEALICKCIYHFYVEYLHCYYMEIVGFTSYIT